MLSDWLQTLGLVPADRKSQLGGYVGYLTPYATSHDDLDRDAGFQEEVRNAARALVEAVKRLRKGGLTPPDDGLREPRPK